LVVVVVVLFDGGVFLVQMLENEYDKSQYLSHLLYSWVVMAIHLDELPLNHYGHKFAIYGNVMENQP
tara:strand:+ start:124 stop:324 length:201 start_codon:yes stop_codon:yes gene_type:complete